MAGITIFAGHYGSGKTNLAVNYALKLRERFEKVILCDLDIVNPYFRTKDSAKELQEHGVELISPEFANTNVDLPTLPPEVNAIFTDTEAAVVIDVGGDDSGAVALGQYADRIRRRGYEMLLVINQRRYLTFEPEEAVAIMDEIQNACHLDFTGIVNNTNIGSETTPDVVLSSLAYADEVSRQTALPLFATTYRGDLNLSLPEHAKGAPIDIFAKREWHIF